MLCAAGLRPKQAKCGWPYGRIQKRTLFLGSSWIGHLTWNFKMVVDLYSRRAGGKEIPAGDRRVCASLSTQREKRGRHSKKDTDHTKERHTHTPTHTQTHTKSRGTVAGVQSCRFAKEINRKLGPLQDLIFLLQARLALQFILFSSSTLSLSPQHFIAT